MRTLIQRNKSMFQNPEWHKMSLVAVLALMMHLTGQAQLQWSLPMKSGVADVVEVDEAGNVYTASYIKEPEDVDPTSGVQTVSPLLLWGSSYATGILINKFSESGSLIWTKMLNATNSEDYLWSFGENLVRDMDIDADGNLYLTGSFYERLDFDPGADQYIIDGRGDDAFLLKLSADGALVWVKTWGGAPILLNGDSDGGTCVRVFGSDLYVCGFYFGTTDFDPGVNEVLRTPFERDAFVSKFDTDGNFSWVRTWGCNGNYTLASSMDVQSNGEVVVAGTFGGTVDFDDSEDVAILSETSSGWLESSYIVRFDADGGCKGVSGFRSRYNAEILDLVVNQNDEIYITGRFMGSVDFDPGEGSYVLTADSAWSTELEHGFLCALNDTCGLIWARSDDEIYEDFLFRDLELQNGSILLIGSKKFLAGQLSDQYPAIKRFDADGALLGSYIFQDNTGKSFFVAAHAISDTKLAAVGIFRNAVNFYLGAGTQQMLALDNTDNQFVAVFDLQGVAASVDQVASVPITALYPNPTSGECYLPRMSTDSNPLVRVYSSTGHLVMECRNSQEVGENYLRAQLDVPDGVYQVQLIEDDCMHSHTLVVKH